MPRFNWKIQLLNIIPLEAPWKSSLLLSWWCDDWKWKKQAAEKKNFVTTSKRLQAKFNIEHFQEVHCCFFLEGEFHEDLLRIILNSINIYLSLVEAFLLIKKQLNVWQTLHAAMLTCDAIDSTSRCAKLGLVFFTLFFPPPLYRWKFNV